VVRTRRDAKSASGIKTASLSVANWQLRSFAAVRLTAVMEYPHLPASVRFDAGELDHLAPLLGFLGDELAGVGGQEREHVATQVGKARLDLGIGEARIDLLVELLNNLGRRVLGRADAEPLARLIASHELTHGRDAPKEPEEQASSVEPYIFCVYISFS